MSVGVSLLVLTTVARSEGLELARLEPGRAEYDLASYTERLEDPDRQWAIDDVVRPPLADRFVSSGTRKLEFGLTRSAYWLRFALRNDSSRTAVWWLCVDWALNDQLDLYEPGPGAGFTERRAGDHLPFAQWEIAYRDPVFPITLAPGEARTFHVRVAGQDALLVPLVVRTEDAFWHHRITQMGWLTFFYGGCVSMIVYNLVIYFSFRHRGYIHYVLFAACSLLWSICTEGLAHRYATPWLANYGVQIFGVGALYFFVYSARAFMEFKTYTPRLDRALGILQQGQAVALVVAFFDVKLFVQLLMAFGIPAFAILVAASARRWRQGAPMARLFTLACAPLVGSALLWGIDSLWPILGSTSLATHALQIGAMVSLVLLPIPLSGRLSLFEQPQALTAELRQRTQELAHSERELAVARDKALAASRAKSTFLANMSHELRTPLNAIIGYSEMIQEDAAETGHTEYDADLQKIVLSGRHLLGLINDVLDLSKIEAGKVELYADDFDVAELVEGVAATVRPLIDRNANRLIVSLAPDAGSMHSDSTRVRQILFNLLSNAAKFTKSGRIDLSVTRRADGGQDWLDFSVADTGIGMSAEQLERIFEAFTQAKASTTSEYGGTGLGLAITRNFCEMLGGSIDVTSEVGRGTRFVARLPSVMPAGEGAPAEATTPTLPAPRPPAAEKPETGKHIVLVIEDNESARELMRRALEREGYAVRTASGGEEGLQLARQCRPDVITVDVMMPTMDGWSVLSALKADPLLADVPVIVITIVENRDLGYALGAAEYLVKPVARERLIEVLARHLSPAARGPVLIVDDDADTRERLSRAIRNAGYQVAQAENGRMALERLATEVPRLILLDLIMPEMDGFEFLAALREHPEWHRIPVVVVTAKDLSAAERAQLGGASERIFQKGAFDTASLLMEVSRLIRTRDA